VLLTFLEKDAASAVFHDTLLHWETLGVVTASNFECVAFVVFAHNSAIDLLTHSSVEEGTAVKQKKHG
jgi:hypothetical protein